MEIQICVCVCVCVPRVAHLRNICIAASFLFPSVQRATLTHPRRVLHFLTLTKYPFPLIRFFSNTIIWKLGEIRGFLGSPIANMNDQILKTFQSRLHIRNQRPSIRQVYCKLIISPAIFILHIEVVISNLIIPTSCS